MFQFKWFVAGDRQLSCSVFLSIAIQLRSNNLLKTTDRKEKKTIPSGQTRLFILLKATKTVLNNFGKLHVPK